MTNPYIEARKKALGKRIADLVFLLNKLNEEYPIHQSVYNVDTYFEYRIAQYQQDKPHEKSK
tara:strand:- start:381 stop:566 length:186 start_codon:yes stop_codon:yes gene_type:complete